MDQVEARGTCTGRLHLRQNKGDRSLLDTPQGGVRQDSKGETGKALVGAVVEGDGEEMWEHVEFFCSVPVSRCHPLVSKGRHMDTLRWVT